jgi:hypothetical protein
MSDDCFVALHEAAHAVVLTHRNDVAHAKTRSA